MIHLDTHDLIGLTKPTTPAGRQVAAWVAAGDPLGCRAMAWAEYLCGPVTAADQADVAALVGTPEPVTEADAARAAALFNATGRRGSLGDCLIAAVALRSGAAVATENRADFAPFAAAGLRVVP